MQKQTQLSSCIQILETGDNIKHLNEFKYGLSSNELVLLPTAPKIKRQIFANPNHSNSNSTFCYFQAIASKQISQTEKFQKDNNPHELFDYDAYYVAITCKMQEPDQIQKPKRPRDYDGQLRQEQKCKKKVKTQSLEKPYAQDIVQRVQLILQGELKNKDKTITYIQIGDMQLQFQPFVFQKRDNGPLLKEEKELIQQQQPKKWHQNVIPQFKFAKLKKKFRDSKKVYFNSDTLNQNKNVGITIKKYMPLIYCQTNDLQKKVYRFWIKNFELQTKKKPYFRISKTKLRKYINDLYTETLEKIGSFKLEGADIFEHCFNKINSPQSKRVAREMNRGDVQACLQFAYMSDFFQHKKLYLTYQRKKNIQTLVNEILN